MTTKRAKTGASPIVWVLNGPNLNLLGKREPEIYGRTTLPEIEKACQTRAKALDLAVDFRQTNYEGELVTWIQDSKGQASGMILNAGAYTHTSVALLDALNYAQLPTIEVHLSQPLNREPFRHHSFVTPAAQGLISGLGAHGYELALEALARLIHKS
ncbi:3-dehydroquinate dehydratase 2 [Rhodospirillaceae bacterium LM-1]|nr:3-dehydroquinate dehydratase 2 [Rhodospirillaceae bacterium LM-1]